MEIGDDNRRKCVVIICTCCPPKATCQKLCNSSAEEQMAMRTAEKLLKEIRPKSVKAEQRIRVLENFALLATKSKPNVERALERFADMASSEVRE